MNLTLDEIELDALTEIFNIGVGQAADAMSQMVGEAILLSVPQVRFVHKQTAIDDYSINSGNRLCAVQQHFEGRFSTDAILMFAEEKSLELVRIMLGASIPLEQLTEMAQEALAEIGNIILNSVIATMADMLHTEFHGTLPVVRTGSVTEILEFDESGMGGMVLLLHIDFIVQSREIRGSLAFLLNLTSAAELKAGIDRFVSGQPE